MGTWWDKHKTAIGPVWYPATPRHDEFSRARIHGEDGSIFGAEQALNATARPAAKQADVNAYAVAKRAGPQYTEAERQYVLAVARGEGYYGLGWTAGNGAGSHNWGAVQGQGPAGSFQHLDHHADGTPYTTAFKAYNNDDEGFTDMAHILIKPNVQAALKKGSLRQAVMAQHDNRYFELDPEKYLSAVLKNYTTLATTLPISKLLSENGVSVPGQIAIAGGVLGGLYAGYRFLSGRKAGKRG